VGIRRPLLEVADVVRLHGEDYCREHRLSAAQRKVLRHIATCRTAALGGHVDECDSCGHQRISYNSCRDRHCPKCQGSQRLQWINQRLERLLPVPYFHEVFTLPEELNPLILRNKAIGYGILFDAAARALLQLARDPRHLGAGVAVTAVLHTWAQNLLFHPHLHCVVSAGGFSADGERWIHGNDRFFLPVKVLGRLFRGKFLDTLNRAYQNRRLDLAGSTAELSDPLRWAALRQQLYDKDWLVYAKPPFAGTEQVFRYLGCYTHRVAISNHRLLELRDDKVTFSVRDNTAGGEKRRMTLEADEFLRRFLLHVLPHRFVRIRHYGLCAGRNVQTKLAAARNLLEGQREQPSPSASQEKTWSDLLRDSTGIDVMACPSCGQQLVRRQIVLPDPRVLPEWYRARASPSSAGAAA
jgi:hypothetical protein